ncbi:MAG: response regulator [Pirellulaceae bacterium]|nr:response regulator [Pirellulaceae bacterium]
MADLISKRVLVVDDNADAADMLAILLRAAGHHVEVAYSGPSGIAVARAQKPQVIFLDVAMPKMDGLKVIRQLRKQPETQDSFIVAVTGFGREVDRERTKEAGFDLHLVKPVEPKTILELLGRS